MATPRKLNGRKVRAWRTVRYADNRYRRVAVVSGKGPRGGATIASPTLHEPGGAYIRPKPPEKFIAKAIQHPGALTNEVRRVTGDPSAHPKDHLPLVRKWSNERGKTGKLTKRALRARFYLRTLRPLNERTR